MSERACNVRSSLAKYLPQSATPPEELRAMAARAWRLQGIVMLKPDEIVDPWVRQTVINEAERLYGVRPKQRDRASGARAATGKNG